MDIDLYRALVGRFWIVLVSIIVVTTLGVVLFTTTRPAGYEGSLYLSIAQTAQQTGTKSNFYEYGEYYSLQGSNFLTDYFRGWLKDPATVNEILTKAGGGLPKTSLRSITRFFDVKSLGTVGLQIFQSTSSQAETQRVLAATSQVLKDRLASLQAQGFYREFAIIPGEIFVQKTSPDLLVNGAIGFVAGLFLAVFALLILAVTVPERR